MSGTTSPANVHVYDAASLLALPTPPPLSAELHVRYGNEGQHLGWSLLELRAMRPDLFHDQDWYDKYPWASEKLPSGIYVLRLPVPDSNRKTFDEQKTLLLPGEESAPVVLAASALLSIRLSGGQDPLKNQWTRCKERTGDGNHVALDWRGGRLNVDYRWSDARSDNVWFAGSRRTS